MSSSEPASRAPEKPTTLEEVLSQVDDSKLAIYRLVRQILDDLEKAAPWDSLYYPPSQTEDFLRMTGLLVAVIGGIPKQIAALIADLEARGVSEELLGDLEFFFHGIHTSVEQELSKLKNLFASFQESSVTRDPSPDERDYVCELSADLKGKYSSSIMGACATLVAEGLWRGVEIEPLLFTEKAREFKRNQKLVATLTEVTENITNLLEQVPLAELVEKWRRNERVDQYALTALYSLLGNLGKLMREDSRRALYSGDYHQIQRREALLAARVNELATLHNTTWGTVTPGLSVTPEEAFPRMAQTATELATVLNVELLKKIIGDQQVESLLYVVMSEKEANSSVDRWRAGHQIKPHKSRERIPEHLHSLIILLYDEDLNTFLELLLGSVLKRASLTVRQEAENAPSPEQMEELFGSLHEEFDGQDPGAPTAPETPAAGAPAAGTPAAADVSFADLAPEQPDPERIAQPVPEPAPPPSPAPPEPAEPVPEATVQVSHSEIAVPGSPEDTAYRQAAPPEVPDIEIAGLDVEVDFDHATPPAAAQPAERAPGPSAAASPSSYPEIDFEPEPASVAEGSWSTGTLGGLQPFEPPEDDFLAPAAAEPVPVAAPPIDPGDAWNSDADPSPWTRSSFDDDLDSLSSPGFEAFGSSDLGAGPPADSRREEKLSALRDLQLLLDRLTSTTASNYKAFLMIHRLLKRGRAIPQAMVQSMQPYLYDVMNELLPRLHESQFEDRFGDYADRLIQDCQLLCLPHFGPDELKTRVAPAIQRVAALLDDLRTHIARAIDEASGLS
ncbi:MAG: hypothetical protein AAF725_14425 [Acidobacteriota bacterium]